jgi:regulator of protease activity HflC (stomatin/prohibitin superfamily)
MKSKRNGLTSLSLDPPFALRVWGLAVVLWGPRLVETVGDGCGARSARFGGVGRALVPGVRVFWPGGSVADGRVIRRVCSRRLRRWRGALGCV